MSTNQPDNKKLVSIREASEILNVSMDTLRRWDKDGTLISKTRKGNTRFFSLTDIENLKFKQSLSISHAAEILKMSASTLRRLEKKGIITPKRNDQGERVYDRKSIEAFLHSEYFINQKTVEEKILAPLSEPKSKSNSENENADENDLGVHNQNNGSINNTLLGKMITDQWVHIRNLLRFRKLVFKAGLVTAGVSVVLIIIISFLYLSFPDQTANYFGLSKNKSLPSDSAGVVLGVKYPTEVLGTRTEKSVLGKVLTPFSNAALEVVSQVNPETYSKIVPSKTIEDINDVFTIDSEGSVTPYYNLSVPDTSYLKIPDSNLVKKLNSEFVQGRVPGSSEGNLAIIGKNSRIEGLKVSKSDILNFRVGSADINDSSIGLSKLAADSVSTSKLLDGTILNEDISDSASISDKKLAQITTGDKVAGSAVELNSTGGLVNASGLSLTRTCSNGEVLSWNSSNSSWECGTGGGSGTITGVTAGDGLTGGGTSGNVTLDIGAGTGITVNANSIEATLGTSVTLTSEVDGVLPIANGGTNTSTIGSAGAIAYSSGSAYAFSGVGTSGQCLTSNGAGAPTWGSCGAGSLSAIRESDGAPSVSNATTLEFGAPTNSEDEFIISEPSSGIARVRIGSQVGKLNEAETVSSLWTFGAGATISTGQSITVNGDSITDFTGSGITLSSGSLQTTLGTSVDLSSEVTGTLPIANGGTGATSLNDLITLGTHTTGNYIATITAGDGISSSGGSTGEGVAHTLSVDTTTSGTTLTTSSNSGLESTSAGIRLLGGCSSDQVLKWNAGSSAWVCSTDTGGLAVEEGDSSISSNASTLDFLASDFIITESPSGEANVAIDYANSSIARVNQSQAVTGSWTLQDSTVTFVDNVDSSKVMAFELSGITTGVTRTLHAPNVSGTIFLADGGQTITNGTWNGSTIAVAYGGTGNTTFTTNGILYGQGTGAIAATTAGSSGQMLVANASGIPNFVSLGGDAQSLSAGGALTIAQDAITFSKMQNITTNRLLGRDTAGTGDIEELTINGGIEFTGSGGLQTSAFTGDVTKAAGGTTLTIASDAVTSAKILDGTVSNTDLANSSITFSGNSGSQAIALGGSLSVQGAGINNAVYSGGTITVTGTEADTLAAVTGRGATTATATSFTGGATLRGLTIDTATATDDLLAVTAPSGGAARFTGTITSSDLTAARTYTLPDATGEFSLLGQTIGLSEIETDSVNSAKIVDGSVSNTDLTNSTVSYGGISLALGSTDATPAFDLTDATNLSIVAGTTGTLSVARGGTGATSLNNLISLGTHTTGNFVNSITIGNGLSSTGASTGEDISHTISLGLLSVADGTGVTSSNSGLEFQGSGNDKLTLLQGCANDEILKWDNTNNIWSCSADGGGSGGSGSLSAIRETDGSPSVANATALEFGPTGDSTEEFIISEPSSGIARVRIGNQVAKLNENETITGDWTFSLNDSENLTLNNTVSSTNSVDLLALNLTNQTTSGTQRGLVINNLNDAANAITESLLTLNNSETTAGTVTDALRITATGIDGGITNAIDVSSPNLVNAIHTGANFVLFDAIRAFEGSPGTLTFEDTSGNDLVRIVDNGITGDLVVTGGDIIGSNNDFIDIAESADATFTLGRNDAGTVTLTSIDDDVNSAFTILPGGAAALTLGGGSTTSITLNTDGSGDAEVVLPTGSISGTEILDDSVVLGTDTSGNYIATIAGANASISVSGSGAESAAATIGVDAITTGTTATTFANSGLEIGSDGLRLVGGCSDTEVLKWSSSNTRWECSTDAGTAPAVFTTISLSSGTNPVADNSTDTLSLVGGNGVTTVGDSGSDTVTFNLAPLTSDWTQSGAFDIVLSHASSEFRMIESVGDTFYATFDVGDLPGNRIYTFSGDSGTVLTDGNYTGTLDAVYVNVGESPAAGDITGSFSGGLTVGANSVALTTDTTGNYVQDITAGSGLTTPQSAGEGTQYTLNIGAGNGITVNADDIALKLDTTGGTTATTSNVSGLEVGSNGLTILRGCSADQVLKWSASGSGAWTCGNDAGAGSSPFTASGGIIDKSTASDRLRLAYGDAGDVQFEITNVSAGIAPTADAMQINLAGGSGIDTDGVDGLFINIEGGGASSKTLSAVHIDFDTVGSPTGTFNAIQIDGIPGSTANENAIQIGSGWDLVLDSENVDIKGSGEITGVNGFTAAGTIKLTGLNCTSSANGGALTAAADGTVSCSDDDGGAGTAWSSLTSPISDLSLNHAENSTTFTWNTDGSSPTSFDGLTLALTNDNSTETETQRLLLVKNNSAVGGTTETLARFENADDGAVTTGIEILGSSTGTITTAIDVSDAEIDTALSFGANDITGTNFNVVGSTGNITSAGDLAINGGDITSTASNLVIDAGSAILFGSGDNVQLQGSGNLLLGTGRIDLASAGNLNIGTTTATSVTIGTGSGNSSIILPTSSIGSSEIVDNDLTGTDIADDILDFVDFADAMTLDTFTTIAHAPASAGTSLDLNISPSVTTGTSVGFEVTPTLPSGATALSLTGIYINPNTNSNLNSGNTLRGMHIGNITGTSNTETAFDIGTGWDTGVNVQSGGIVIQAGALAVNSDSITSDDTLTIDSSGIVQLGTNDTFQLQGTGNLLLGTGRIDLASAGVLNLGTTTATSAVLGSSSLNSFTVVTNSTGDGEVVLPTGSIGTDEILNNTIDFADIADALVLDGPTTITRTSSATSEDTLTLSLVNNDGTAGTDRLFVIKNALTSVTSGDLNTEALLVLDQADTTASGNTAVNDALLITNSGGSTLTDGIQIGSGSQIITNAINIGSTGIVTDLNLQNGETIDNDTDGIVLITSPTTQTSGNLNVAGTGGLTLTGAGGEIVFANNEKIDNDVDGTILITATTTSLSSDLIVQGGDISGGTGTAIDLGESTSGAITFTGNLIVANSSYLGLSASAGRFVFTDAATDLIDLVSANFDINNNSLIGGAAAIDFAEFDVSASTGSITIDDNGNAGNISIEGTILDINSLDFVGAGSITTGGNGNLSITTNGTGDFLVNIDSDSEMRLNGGADGIDAFVISAGDILLSDGDLDIAGGDFNVVLDAADGASITSAAAATSDGLTLTHSGVGTDGLQISFTQTDDADATDTSAGLHIAGTSSSGDADTFYGINIANLTSGAATETALNIGTGWDNGIIVGSGGVTISSGALAVNSDTITSDGELTINASNKVLLASGDTFQLQGSGNLLLGTGRIDLSSAGSLNLGTTTATSIAMGSNINNSFTVTTDGTGDSEVVLPTGSIGALEILDNSLTGSDFADDTIDWADISDSMTLDAATTISSTVSTKSFSYSVQPEGTATSPILFELVPIWGIDGPDQTLIGLNVAPNTNSNTDSGDILYGVQIANITSTPGTETALVIGTGWDTSITAAGNVDFDGTITAGSSNIALTNSTGNLIAGAYGAASIDGDDLASSVAGAGLVLSSGSPDTLDIELIASDGSGGVSAASGLEFSVSGSSGRLGLLQGCANSQVLKWADGLSLWQCSDDVSAGTPTLDTLSAAIGEGTAQDSNENTVRWNWDFTGAAATEDSGLLISESSASTAGDQDKKSLFKIRTLSSSTASPLHVESTSADVGDITFALAGAGDFVLKDGTIAGGTSFVQFNDDASILLGHSIQTTGITIGQSTASNTINIGNANTTTGNTQTINIGAGTPAGTGLTAITLGNTLSSSSLDLRSGTGDIELDAVGTGADILADAAGAISLDATGASSNLTVTGSALNMTVAAAGGGAQSLILSSAGTGANAVQLLATAGGIDISASGASAGEDIDLTATGSSINLISTEGVADAIRLAAQSTSGSGIQLDAYHASNNPTGLVDIDAGSGGILLDTVDGEISLDAEGISSNFSLTSDSAGDDLTISVIGSTDSSLVLASSGTAADALQLLASAGGIDITASGGAGEDIDLTSSGSINLTSNEGVADGLVLTSSSGGIDILATGGTAGEDIDITASTSSVVITGGEAISNAIRLNASNAAGGIDIDSGTGGFIVDTTGAISLDSTALSSNLTLSSNSASNSTLTIASTNAGAGTAALDIDSDEAITIDSAASGISLDSVTASNFTVTGAGQDLTLSSVGGSVLMSSTENVAQAIRLHANGGTSETIQLHSDQGTGASSLDLLSDAGGITLTAGLGTADAINLNASNAAGGIDIDSGTGGFIVDTTGLISLDSTNAGNSNISVNAAGADLTLEALGGGSNQIILSSAGTGTDAIRLNATGTGGDIDIDANDAITVDSTSFSIDSTAASNITTTGANLTVSTTTSGNLIFSSAGTGADALQITTSSGGIDILAAGNAAGEDLDITATGTSTEIRITSASNQSDALRINTTAGGIDIDSAGIIALTTSATDSNALDFDVTGASGGMTFNTSDGSIALSAGGADNGDITLTVGDDFTLNGVGGSIYQFGAATTTGTITIGGTAQTGLLTLGQSSGTNTVAIGSGTGATTVQIATGATNAKTVQIGTGAVANTITIGSSSTTGLSITENDWSISTAGLITTASNVAVNGGSITTTAGTFNLVNTNATTINFGGAATTLTVGATSGTTTVRNGLTINGNTTLGDASGDTVTFNAAGVTFANSSTVTLANTANALNFDSNTFIIDALNNRVAIGAASPNRTLDVTGDIEINNTSGDYYHNSLQGLTQSTTCGAGSAYRHLEISGGITITATCVSVASDARLKENIQTEQNILEKINKLNPATFLMNDIYYRESGVKEDQGLQHGFIAQELEEVFPELIGTAGFGGYKGVNYIGLVSIITAGLQEVDKKVDANKLLASDGLKVLSQKIEGLDQRVKALESKDPSINKIVFDNRSVTLSKDGKFVIKNANGEEKARIDSSGNAYFAGSISAKSILANQIDGLKAVVDEAVKDAQSTATQKSASELDELAQSNSGKALDLNKLSSQSDQALAQKLNGESSDNVLGAKNTNNQVDNTADVNLQAFTDATQEGSITVDRPVEFKNKSLFSAFVEFINNVIFRGDVRFLGRATFNKDTAGFAEIAKGARKVKVEFEREYETVPVVTASAVWDISDEMLAQLSEKEIYLLQKQDYIVAAINKKGFTIILEEPAIVDLKFTWNALAVEGGGSQSSSKPVESSSTNSDKLLNSDSISPTPDSEEEDNTVDSNNSKDTVVVSENELGFLRVRIEPKLDSEELGRVEPGDKFEIKDAQNGWYKIEYVKGKSGWVSSEYVKLLD